MAATKAAGTVLGVTPGKQRPREILVEREGADVLVWVRQPGMLNGWQIRLDPKATTAFVAELRRLGIVR